MEARQSRSAARRLFVLFAALGLVPVLALGVVLMRESESNAHAQGLMLGRTQATLISQTAITPALQGVTDLSAGISAGRLVQLERATGLAVYQGTILHLRLRTFSGRIVFSDDGRFDRALSNQTADFAAATRGQTAVDVVDDTGGPPAIRVLQPVVATTTGQACGVLELYLPYDAIAASLHAQLRRTTVAVGTGLGALYVTLLLISWLTTRGLRRLAALNELSAITDSMTGLPNRAHFQQASTRWLALGKPFAVVLMDLNGFKQINDSLGHHVGDELLIELADRLRQAVCAGDFVARLGGDEFGFLLAGGDEGSGVSMVAQIRARSLDDHTFTAAAVTVGSSFGIALYPRHGRDIEQLLQYADTAMYRGKKGHEDGIVTFSPPAAPEPGAAAVVPGQNRPRGLPAGRKGG